MTVAQEAAVATEAPARIPAVTVAEVTMRELLQQVPVSGTLVPREEVLVYPEIGGYAITQLSAEVGDRVEAGQVIAQLNSEALRSQVMQAEAELARTEAAVSQAQSQVASTEATLTRATEDLERTRTLQESGTTTVAALDDAKAIEITAEAGVLSALNGVAVAEAQLRQAQAALDLARLNLENAQITSPVDGVISARSGQVGAIASTSGEPIYRIIRDGLVEVEAEVIESDLALVGVGDPAELRVSGLPPMVGTVRLISPAVDAASRLGTVRIAVDPDEDLRPGLFSGGWITVERRQGLAVPASAVITDGEGSYLLRVGEKGVLERRAVTPGLLWQDWFEIADGLEPGEEVVARAGAFFGQGDVIRPVRGDEHPLADLAGGDDASAQTADLAQAGTAQASEDGQ
jgi:HlyD family secretion protein